MAVKDGLPSTDFSRQNREYIKELIEESGGGGGGELDSAYFFVEIEENPDADDPTWHTRTAATVKEILDAMDAGKILIGNPGDFFNCGDAGHDKYFLTITSIFVDIPASTIVINATDYERVDAADIATAHFIETDDSMSRSWTVAMTPEE